MTDVADTGAEMTEAMTRIRRAREVVDALAPLRRVITDADEELRAAVLAGSHAGLSERALAAQAETSQPTVRGYLDSRRGAPTPSPGVAEQLWAYHRVASSLATLVKRVTSHKLPYRAPTTSHSEPTSAVKRSHEALDTASGALANAASAIEYTDRNLAN